MKTYNTKLAVLVFTIIAAVDVVVLALSMPAWLTWSINAPGLPLIYLFKDMLQPGSLSMGGLFIGSLLLSAILWSVVAGYVFRRRYAA